MKIARAFLIGMYVHLALSIAVPFSIIFVFKGWNAGSTVLFVFYLAAVIALLILGWVSAAMAIAAYLSGQYDKLGRGWKLLKLGSVPFYVLNFIYSVIICVAIIMGTRGLFIILVPIPVIITCTMIVQSGIFGICYVKHLRNSADGGYMPYPVHYVMQLISVLDVISTAVILIHEKHRETQDAPVL